MLMLDEETEQTFSKSKSKTALLIYSTRMRRRHSNETWVHYGIEVHVRWLRNPCDYSLTSPSRSLLLFLIV